MQEKLKLLDVTICKQNNKIITSCRGSATNRIGGGPWPPPPQVVKKINEFLKFTIDFNNFDALAPPPNFKPVVDPLTSWYRKSSNTLNFTSWNSFGPKTHKINTVKAIIKRLKVICSDELTLRKIWKNHGVRYW